MVESELGLLRSKPEDHELHRSRIMFCIKDDRVEVASSGTINSHLEWFEEEGWFAEESAENFLNKNIRGFYFPPTNSLYCYRGVDFSFDEEVIAEVKKRLVELKKALDLNDDSRICFGPKDSPIGEREYPRRDEGRLKDLI